ncbi:MAG: acetoin utilization deacetylase AcuC-like enzyme [Oceanospirillaceae bacterium]|jgi:acetoin utilization deacetylase AcuC-like enzyme|tara:strand:- start:2647 stop:3684 length:1038 start_codon:yes stop_codon:yes gene_type:complete
MKTVYSPDHILRNAKTELAGGQLVTPFECHQRADYVVAAIKSQQLGQIVPPTQWPRQYVESIHDPGYLTFLDTVWQRWVNAGNQGEAIPNVWPSRSMPSQRIPRHIEGQLGYYSLAGETSISGGTAEAAWVSANVALSAAELLNQHEHSAFALCRPPGHHASNDQYGGYCFINNAAIAAQKLRYDGAQKVAILDVDFHHGNGTQKIFYQRDDVLFCSIHGDPMVAFPYFLGFADETGEGPGAGLNLNIPLPPGTPYSIWRVALCRAITKILGYGADAIVVSLGVDTFENDPISFFKLRSDDFIDMGKTIASMGLPTLFIMEGGYAVEEIGTNTVNVLKGFENLAG